MISCALRCFPLDGQTVAMLAELLTTKNIDPSCNHRNKLTTQFMSDYSPGRFHCFNYLSYGTSLVAVLEWCPGLHGKLKLMW